MWVGLSLSFSLHFTLALVIKEKGSKFLSAGIENRLSCLFLLNFSTLNDKMSIF